MVERGSEPVVVVTGGSGMLGRTLIDRLIGEHQVVSLDLKGDPQSAPGVEFICTDVTSDDSVRRALDRIATLYGPRLASVVHLAAFYDFSGAPSPLYERITVEGTRRLLEASKALELEQFVFSSTMLVHRPTSPGRPIDEDDPLIPTWPYPDSKVRTEELIRDQHDEVPIAVLRLAGVYDEDGHSPPLADQIKRIHSRSITSRFYPAALSRGQSFVHRADAIEALALTVERRHQLPAETTILVGEPTTLGYGDVQHLIGQSLHGEAWRTFRVPVPLAKLGAWVQERAPLVPEPFVRSWMVERASDHYELDISRARQQLGWEPRHRLREVIPEMVRRLRTDPEAWYQDNKLTLPRRAAA